MKISIACDHGAFEMKEAVKAHLNGQGHDIGVVVEPGHLGGPGLVQQSAANALDLVSGDGSADAGGAEHDALLALAGRDSLGGGGDHVGVVAAGEAVAAEVHDLMALLLQVGLDGLLHLECAVIAGNGNFHW